MNKFTLKVFALAAGMMLSVFNASAQQVFFYESFNGLKEAEGGNDGYFDNTDAPDGDICEFDLKDASSLDNQSGWGDFVAIAQGKQCIRISSKNKSGCITTPPIELNDADAVLTFRAAGYSTDVATLYVKVLDDEALLSYNGTTGKEIAITVPASDKASTVLANQIYTVKISGVKSSAQLAFSTVSSNSDKQRVFLDEIKVVKDATNGITSIQKNHVASDKIYTIEGKEVNIANLQHGVYIRNGKKIVL